MKIQKYAIVLLSGMLLIHPNMSVAAPSDYSCKPTLFGLCRTNYIGPVNQTAVQQYITDSVEAVKQVSSETNKVSKVYFFVGRGTLVVESAKNSRPDNYDIANYFNLFVKQHHLKMTQVVVKNYGGYFTTDVRNDDLVDHGGDSRFWALQNVKVNTLQSATKHQMNLINSALYVNPTDVNKVVLYKSYP